MLGVFFAALYNAVTLPLFLVLIALLVRNFYVARRALSLLVSNRYVRDMFEYLVPWKIYVRPILLSLALIMFFLSLLRPQWGKSENTVPLEGRDVVIALDVSRSMLASDVKPNRLEFAKAKIRSLLQQLPADRAGLVLFSGDAFVACPLTSDPAAFLSFLGHVDAQSISSGTTALDAALRKARSMFTQTGRKNKLVVLITDGEDFSQRLTQTRSWVKKEGVVVCALGCASPEGAPIPVLSAEGKQVGIEKDESGKPILSMLNQELLADMCKQLGGTYAPLSRDDTDVEMLAHAIKRFEKEKFNDTRVSFYEDRYPWFLAVAWMLLLIEWLL